MPIYEITVRETRVFKQRLVAHSATDALQETIDMVHTGLTLPTRTRIDTIDCDVTDVTNSPITSTPAGPVRIPGPEMIYRTVPTLGPKADVYVYQADYQASDKQP